jgi:hypothetical protein
MKLGVAYNVFDGEELLEYSIGSVRAAVDFVCVVFQEVSNFGNPCSPELLPTLTDLYRRRLIDKLVRYTPVDSGGQPNEIAKRNIGLQLCRNEGCTHFLALDCDEVYEGKQFEYAKREVEDGGYDASACQMVTYYKEPIYRLEPKEAYYVSMIYQIDGQSKFELNCPFPVVVDGARRIPSRNVRVFGRNEVEMHHYSYVRENILSKLQNSSALHFYADKVDMIEGAFRSWHFGQPAFIAPGIECDIVRVEPLISYGHASGRKI